ASRQLECAATYFDWFKTARPPKFSAGVLGM
ncbi:MAG: hypothetical protein ACI8S3_002726, partial [Alphaproteobacteria bacterium]